MNAEEVKNIIESQLQGSQVITGGEGCSFEVTVINEQFAGLMPVKKQLHSGKHCRANKRLEFSKWIN